MCGIVGVLRFDTRPVSEELLRTMTSRLAHRGPDDEGYWCDGSIGFGHRRLSIIDVDGSRQPMSARGGRLHVTFNGEILNYRKLRAECDYAFRTDGDTEVLLALHDQFGAAGVDRLEGQFAYALDDGDDLWLVRDRMGILPLFYYQDDQCFAFASELKALLPALPRQPSIDTRSLDSYLARRAVAAPYTLIEGVRKVLPGHTLRVSRDGRVDQRPYWSLPDGEPRAIGDEQAVHRVAAALREAVDRSLVADVPVGALLSGGLDSSLIVAMAAQQITEPIHTFAAGFGDPRFDELAVAREVSRRFATSHHEVVVDAAGFSEQWRRLTWHRDAPISEPADVAVFELASVARQSVKVVLTGEGADEIFGGYPKYQFARWANSADWIPAGVRQPGLERLAQAMPASAQRARIALRALSAPTESERLALWFAPFLAAERHELLGPIDGRPLGDTMSTRSDPIARMLAYDCQAWLADNLLERGDRMAMAAGIEIRPPYLDRELVELAFSLPSNFKVRGLTRKWVLKQVAQSYLPSSIVNRPKVGFRVPLDHWFRNQLCGMARDHLLDPGSFVGTNMNTDAVRALLESHESGRRDESIRIWTLLSLEVWHEVFFARPFVGSEKSPS